MSSSTSSTTISHPSRPAGGITAHSHPMQSSYAATAALHNALNSVPYQATGDRRIKIVMVGNACVGKTSLLFAYMEGTFLADHHPTVFDNYAVSVSIDGRRVTLNLFDTAGGDAYAHLRTLSYPNADVFLLCFSMVDASSLEACQHVWMPEIRKHVGPDAQVMLVGTQEDLVGSSNANSLSGKGSLKRTARIDAKSAQRCALDMGCRSFVACSSLTHRGLKRVFDEAILLALNARKLGASGGAAGAASGYGATGGSIGPADSEDFDGKIRCCGCCSVM